MARIAARLNAAVILVVTVQRYIYIYIYTISFFRIPFCNIAFWFLWTLNTMHAYLHADTTTVHPRPAAQSANAQSLSISG